MLSQPPQTALEVEDIGDVTVVRFARRSLLGPDLIADLSEQLRQAVVERGCRKLVLNFEHVESMTSALVGLVVLLKNKVEAGGGRLALCSLDPFLKEIFKTLNLAQAFTLYADEAAARASF
jgi:anti-anti-sigma factor